MHDRCFHMEPVSSTFQEVSDMSDFVVGLETCINAVNKFYCRMTLIALE